MSIDLPVATAVDDCWNRIGVNGDRTCPELSEHVHCRNCPVFAGAARAFFDRRAPEGYLAEWADLLGRPRRDAGRSTTRPLLVFRLGVEWLALALSVVAEVTALRPVHRVPHRTNRVFSGLVSLRGQLQLCVSLHGLLDVDPADPAVEPAGEPPAGRDPQGVRDLGLPGRGGRRRPPGPARPAPEGPLDPGQPGRELQPGRLRLGRGAERRRPRRAPGLRGAPEDGGMSDDLSGFSLMDLFRSEADGQVALLTEGLLALEGSGAPSPAALESLMRAAHSLKGAARIVGLDAAVRVAHALEDNFVAAQRGEFAIRSPGVDVMLKAVDLLAPDRPAPRGRRGLLAGGERGADRGDGGGPGGAPDGRGGGAGGGASAAARPPRPSPTRGGGRPRSSSASPSRTRAGAVPLRRPSPPRGRGPGRGDAGGLLEADPRRRPIRPRRPPLARGPGRVVRVSAESLSRLMGLAGESLVQARQLRPFVEALVGAPEPAGGVDRGVAGGGGPPDVRVGGRVGGRGRAPGQGPGRGGPCVDELSREVEAFDDYARRGEDLAGRLHHEVLASRMRPMSEGVRGFPRMVREVSRELGKKVRFEVRGESTGVDRDILDIGLIRLARTSWWSRPARSSPRLA